MGSTYTTQEYQSILWLCNGTSLIIQELGKNV